MTQHPRQSARYDRKSRRKRTLSSLLFPLPGASEKILNEIEEFRIEYEVEHGETDITKRYTSVWPGDQQEWLLEHNPKRYFDGLPSFAKAYLKGKIELAAADGMLDDMPEEFITLFIQGQLNLPEESREL